MLFSESFKNLFTKQYYHFDKADINLYDFHPQVLITVASLGIFYRKRNSFLRFIWPFIGVGLTLVGVAFELINIQKGLKMDEDYSYAIESFSYLVLLGSIPCIFFGILSNRTKVLDLLEEINADFKFICNLGSTHRELFLKNQLLIWKLTISWAIFIAFIGSMFMIFPVVMLIYQSLFSTQDEHMIRPLPFPIWLPKDDAYRTPNYEILLFISLLFCIIFTLGFGGYVCLLFHFLLHYYTILEMIILDFDVIFDGLDESVVCLPRNDLRRITTQIILNKRLGRIVDWHISVFKALSSISSVFGPPLVYQVMCSSFAICLMAYQTATLQAGFNAYYGYYKPSNKHVNDLENGRLNFLFMLLFIACCVQLWIPCYLGTLMRNKGFEVGDACWNCGWERTLISQLIRTDIVIIILRTQKPIYIRFTGVPAMELETFSSILRTSYSYFNILRQYS